MRSLIFFALVTSAAAACTPYDPELGPSPFKCGPADQNPRCPDGYTCEMTTSGEYCLAMGGMVPVDASTLSCADDSALEPNDSIAQAFQTPVATTKNTLTFAGLAICPMGDKDDYSVTITTANQNLEVLLEFDAAAGADLDVQILNSGGQAIANGSPMSQGMKRAYTPNLPTSVYYASVAVNPMSALKTNNYKLTITVTGP